MPSAVEAVLGVLVAAGDGKGRCKDRYCIQGLVEAETEAGTEVRHGLA